MDGWSDPRFPTVRGVLRQGMTVEGLRNFILGQGSSNRTVAMEWDKIWATNKKVIDPVAPRHTALTKANMVPVTITNYTQGDGQESESVEVQLHPKNAEVGTKQIVRSKQILLEQVDAQNLSVGEKITLVEWGNARVIKINKLDHVSQSLVSYTNVNVCICVGRLGKREVGCIVSRAEIV